MTAAELNTALRTAIQKFLAYQPKSGRNAVKLAEYIDRELKTLESSTTYPGILGESSYGREP